MLRQMTIATALLLPGMACDPGPVDATDRAAQGEGQEPWRPRPLGPPTVFGALAKAADEAASLDDEQQGLLELALDDFAQTAQRHALAKESVNAALAAGAQACDFDGDDVVAATDAAAASARVLGAAEVEAIDALHALLGPTQRMLVVRAALEHEQASRPPRRSFIRVLARVVELTDDQILAAADGLADQESSSDDDLLPPDPTALFEAFSRESFSAADFDIEVETLAQTEARGAWLISSLGVFCPVLDAEQRAALADGLLEPFADPGPPGNRGAEPR